MPELFNQVGEEMFLDLPHDRIIDSEIVVHDPISKAPDSMPVDVLMEVSELIGQAVGGFSDHFEITDHGIRCFAVGSK